MTNFIKTIIYPSIPSEIHEMIIEAVAVIMTGAIVIGTWTNKGRKNKFMDIFRVTFIDFSQMDITIASIVNGLFKYGLWGNTNPLAIFQNKRPDLAEIRNFIVREIINRFPNFLRSVKLVITHGLSLLNKLRLWGEPLSCSRRAAARLFIT